MDHGAGGQSCRRKEAMVRYHGYVCYELFCRGFWLRRSHLQVTGFDGLDWADEDMQGTQGKSCPFTYLVDAACQHPPMSVKESKSSADVENIYLKPVTSALSQLPGML